MDYMVLLYGSGIFLMVFGTCFFIWVIGVFIAGVGAWREPPTVGDRMQNNKRYNGVLAGIYLLGSLIVWWLKGGTNVGTLLDFSIMHGAVGVVLLVAWPVSRISYKLTPAGNSISPVVVSRIMLVLTFIILLFTGYWLISFMPPFVR